MQKKHRVSFIFIDFSPNVVSTLIQKPYRQQIVLSCSTFLTHLNAFHIAWVFAVTDTRENRISIDALHF